MTVLYRLSGQDLLSTWQYPGSDVGAQVFTINNIYVNSVGLVSLMTSKVFIVSLHLYSFMILSIHCHVEDDITA